MQYLFPDFPYAEILIADTRKPYLPNEQYHFSISHCADYAAAIVSSTHRVGVDIETPSEKVERISRKFVHENDWKNLPTDHSPQSIVRNNMPSIDRRLLTVLWSAKEALFKWYSLGGIDFKEHMQLNNPVQKQNDSLILPFVFKKNEWIELIVVSKIFDELVLSWVL